MGSCAGRCPAIVQFGIVVETLGLTSGDFFCSSVQAH